MHPFSLRAAGPAEPWVILQAENVLLDRKGHCKLGRFELAKQLGRGSGSDPPRTFTVCAGKLGNLAPEQVLHLGHDRAVDLWGLGVLLFELLTGHSPFEIGPGGRSSDSSPLAGDALLMLQRIVEGRYLVKAASECKHYTPVVADLVRRLLTVDPIRRLGGGGGSALDILEHKWMQSRSTIDLASVKEQRCAPPWKIESIFPPPVGTGSIETKIGDLADF